MLETSKTLKQNECTYVSKTYRVQAHTFCLDACSNARCEGVQVCNIICENKGQARGTSRSGHAAPVIGERAKFWRAAIVARVPLPSAVMAVLTCRRSQARAGRITFTKLEALSAMVGRHPTRRSHGNMLGAMYPVQGDRKPACACKWF